MISSIDLLTTAVLDSVVPCGTSSTSALSTFGILLVKTIWSPSVLLDWNFERPAFADPSVDLKVPDLIFLLKNSGLEAFIPTVSILGMDGGNLIKLASDGDSWNRAFEAFTKPERENLKALVDKWAKNGLWSPGIA
jgi:hypothetical protein